MKITIYLFLALFLISFSYGLTTVYPLTKGQADVLYCHNDGVNCNSTGTAGSGGNTSFNQSFVLDLIYNATILRTENISTTLDSRYIKNNTDISLKKAILKQFYLSTYTGSAPYNFYNTIVTINASLLNRRNGLTISTYDVFNAIDVGEIYFGQETSDVTIVSNMTIRPTNYGSSGVNFFFLGTPEYPWGHAYVKYINALESIKQNGVDVCLTNSTLCTSGGWINTSVSTTTTLNVIAQKNLSVYLNIKGTDDSVIMYFDNSTLVVEG
jgi:hypothetical protein